MEQKLMTGYFDDEIRINDYPMLARFFYEDSADRLEVTSCFILNGAKSYAVPLPAHKLNEYIKNIPGRTFGYG